MQEELQGTTFSEAAQRIKGTRLDGREAAGYETGKTAQACHRIESLLDEMLAELPEKRSLTLLQGNLILSLVVALLFPLLVYGFRSMGSSGNLDNMAASVVLFMIAGVLLSALLAGTGSPSGVSSIPAALSPVNPPAARGSADAVHQLLHAGDVRRE